MDSGNHSLTRLDNLMPDVNELRVYEARIATKLNAGTAVFSAALRRLYFCDSPQCPIEPTVRRMFSLSGRLAPIEPVLIDQLGVFEVARKVPLDDLMKPRVFTALRLLGVATRDA